MNHRAPAAVVAAGGRRLASAASSSTSRRRARAAASPSSIAASSAVSAPFAPHRFDDRRRHSPLRHNRPLSTRPRRLPSPPSSEARTAAQAFESRHADNAVGFHVHDGPVPINRTARAAARERRARRKRSRQRTSDDPDGGEGLGAVGAEEGGGEEEAGEEGGNGSLVDPHYDPPLGASSQTHLLQGGTPCDLPPRGTESSVPYRLASYGESSVYTLILLRHGESEWNVANRYTGWCDVDLTERGEDEARSAGRLLKENGIEVDHCFASALKRASFTANMCLNMAGQHWVPVTKTWRLNERHYGALQGYNKDSAHEELGMDQELVMEMRKSYATAPPRMDDDHPHWHGNDRRYAKLTEEQLERSRAESLRDAAERIMPFFNKVVVPSLREGNRCLVVSHANTIRTLVKQIDDIGDEDIKNLSIPTGIPLIYRLDRNLRPVDPNCELEFRYMVKPRGYTWATSRRHGFHGVYLGDLERLQDIQGKRDAAARHWQRVILRNVARQVSEEDARDDRDDAFRDRRARGEGLVETKHLWWRIVRKMRHPEYGNMLLLVRMREFLEGLLASARSRRQHRYIPLEAYEKIVEKIHLDSAGEVVDPFVSLEDREDREERQRRWIEGFGADDREDAHSLIN